MWHHDRDQRAYRATPIARLLTTCRAVDSSPGSKHSFQLIPARPSSDGRSVQLLMDQAGRPLPRTASVAIACGSLPRCFLSVRSSGLVESKQFPKAVPLSCLFKLHPVEADELKVMLPIALDGE